MLRAMILGVLAAGAGACDPIRTVSASGPIPAPLDSVCILEALREDAAVQSAGVSERGVIWAELSVPQGLECPEARPEVGLELRRTPTGEHELHLEMVWVGRRGSAEYRAWVQQRVEALRDRVLARCGGG